MAKRTGDAASEAAVPYSVFLESAVCNEMKRVKVIAIIACVVAVFGMNITFAFAESFETKDYSVQMDVYENNSFLVTEDIKVNFTEPRHGIYRYIPYKGRRQDR